MPVRGPRIWPSRRDRRLLHLALLPGAALSLIVGLASTAYGNDISGTYRTEGFVKAAKQPSPYTLNVSSQECTQSQLDAYSAVLMSTQNSGGTFGTRWPGGIKMQRAPSGACTGTLTTATDIRMFYYDTDSAWHNAPFGGHSSEAGGEEHAVPAPQAYCTAMGLTSTTCGLHPSVIHVNGVKWHATSSAGQKRLIMHETGHSQGLWHHCLDHSVMNDGTNCHVDHWLTVTGYLATDRAGVVAVYPNWPYNN